MMGMALTSLDVPVCKGTSAILCLTKEEAELPEEQNCIRCGRCIAACPMNLMPLQLNQYAIHKETDKFEAIHGMDCMECGCCSFVCPAKRHIVQSVRTAKKLVRSNKKMHKGKLNVINSIQYPHHLIYVQRIRYKELWEMFLLHYCRSNSRSMV